MAIAALAAVYAGDLDRAGVLRDRLVGIAASPSDVALSCYVAGEIDSVAGRHDQAEAHYARAIELARAGGATFLIGVASVGLLTVQSGAGRIDDALRGYREVIDYWARTGSWIQQWTTLRNLAQLLHVLGDHQPALFLEVAADHAPEASPVSDAAWKPSATELREETTSHIRASAVGCARSDVLDVARRAIDRHLRA